MRKFSLFCLGIIVAATTAFSTNSIGCGETAFADSNQRFIYVGGYTAGFNLNTIGVQVLAVTEFPTENGSMISPAAEAGIKQGDHITEVAGKEIREAADLNELVSKSGGKGIGLTVKRAGESQKITVYPKLDKISKQYKLGVLIRDNVSGIGTITYLDKENNRFGALGHGVYDEDGTPMTAVKGNIYECGIVSVNKGVRGKAGELKGIFTGESDIGKAEYINECGLYGTLNDSVHLEGYEKAAVASLSEVKMGDAYIYSTISGFEPQKYDISIVKVDENNKQNKNFVVKIKDEELLAVTGGIVQGMSGSPIIQNGKIIGALTHVFLNDPTRGYGIGIEKMLNNQ